MREVLSVITFGIGALCFVAFFTAFKPLSSTTYLARNSGPRRPGATPTAPMALNRDLIAGVSIAAWVASFSVATMSFGAPFGRKKAVQVTTS